MKNMKYILLLAALLAAYTAPCSAQRTMRSQFFIDAEGRWPLGAQLSLGQYTNVGYWNGFLTADRLYQTLVYSDGQTAARLDYYRIAIGAEYMARIAGTRSRSLSLYGGGGGMIGIELVDPFSLLPKDIVIQIDGESPAKRAFIFGVRPRILCEWYLSQRFALTAGCVAPIYFGSQWRYLSVMGTLGMRVNVDW